MSDSLSWVFHQSKESLSSEWETVCPSCVRKPLLLVILRLCLGSLLSHCSLCVCFRFPWVQVCLKCVSTPLIPTYVRSWLIFKPLSHVWLTASTAPVTTSNCRKISASLHRKVKLYASVSCTATHWIYVVLQRKHVFVLLWNMSYVFCWNEWIL